MLYQIKVTSLTVRVKKQVVIDDISVDFPVGSMTAIVGPNGAGKTTLLRAILGIIRCDQGCVEYISPSLQIAYLPQISEIDRTFPISVLDLVLLGAWRRVEGSRGLTKNDIDRAHHIIDECGLRGLERRAIGNLSVGQFQRALFARTCMQDADLILLDEPFAAVDADTTNDLLRILRSWHQIGRTIITVLHDLAQVRAHFPRALLLAKARVDFGDVAAVITPENLTRAKFLTAC